MRGGENKSIRLFKNRVLEKMTHVHPAVPILLWGPVIVGLLWRTGVVHGIRMGENPLLFLGLFVSGILVWSLSEYALHRFIFHFQGQGWFLERMHFLIHGIHHEAPQDKTRLVMPPVAGIILAVILYSFFMLFLGSVWVDPFFAFFLVGYLWYDYTHYYIHHFQPRTRLGRLIKQNHMKHHFVSPDYRWGVSSPLWDYVFGTLDEPSKSGATTKTAEHGS